MKRLLRNVIGVTKSINTKPLCKVFQKQTFKK